jgi:hypothetical protein
LGEAIEELEKPVGAVRCTKDLVEEALFERRRDLFTEMELVFSAPLRSTLKAKAQRSVNAVTIRITDPISSRWWSGWPSMWKVARFAVRCGPATPPTSPPWCRLSGGCENAFGCGKLLWWPIVGW